MQGKLCIFLFLINKLFAQVIISPNAAQNLSIILPFQSNLNQANTALPVVPNLSLIVSNASLYQLSKYANEYYNSDNITPENTDETVSDQSDYQSGWGNGWQNDKENNWDYYDTNITDYEYEDDENDEDDDYDENDTVDVSNEKPQCESCQCGLRLKRRSGNSTPAIKSEFPSIVEITTFGRLNCGGSLINDLYVLTAAQCTFGYPKASIAVRFRKYSSETPSEPHTFRRTVAEIIRHPGFANDPEHNDIVLLKLSKRVKMEGNLLRPICLPTSGNTYAKQRGVIADWGVTANGDFARVLRRATITIFSNQKCRRTVYGSTITDSMMCAGFIRGGKDWCSGDRGAPLMVRDEQRIRLAGIVSFGGGCVQPNAPRVYTRISKFVDWIRKNTQDACYCSS